MAGGRLQAGDTLVEVVIAIAILALTLSVAYSLANTTYRVGTNAREHTQAAYLLQQQAEMLRRYRDQLAQAAIAAGNTDPTSPSYEIFTPGQFPNPMYFPFSVAPTLSPTGGTNIACFGLPSCTLSITTDNLVNVNAINHQLSKVDFVLEVKWESLIGSTPNDLKLNYTLTDSRQLQKLPSGCDTSLAGSC